MSEKRWALLQAQVVWPCSSALGMQHIFYIKLLDKSYSQHMCEGPITPQAQDTIPAPAAFSWSELTCQPGVSLVSHRPKIQRASPITSNPPGLCSLIPWEHPSIALGCYKNPQPILSSSICSSTGSQRKIPTRSSCPITTSPTSPNWTWPILAPTAGGHPQEWSIISSLHHGKHRYPQPCSLREKVPVLEAPSHQPPSKHTIKGLALFKNSQCKKRKLKAWGDRGRRQAGQQQHLWAECEPMLPLTLAGRKTYML